MLADLTDTFHARIRSDRSLRRANTPNTVDEFLLVFLGAPESRREAALQVLRGEAIAVDPTVEPRPFEPLLTRREAARRLGLSAQTLRRWKVPGICLQGVLRFRLSEIEAYLQTEEFRRRRAAVRAERKLSAKGTFQRPKPQTTNP